MVDVGIIFSENILRHLEMPENEGVKGKKLVQLIYLSVVEVGSAVLTALATIIVAFIPVFSMQASEGKLFRPLASTEIFALVSSIILGIIVLPSLAHVVFSINFDKKRSIRIFNGILIGLGLTLSVVYGSFIALVLVVIGINNLLTIVREKTVLKGRIKLPYSKKIANYVNIAVTLLVIIYFLTLEWMPLGVTNSLFVNLIFVVIISTVVLGTLMTIVHYYPKILVWCLNNKLKFLSIPIIIFLFGVNVWMGFGNVFGFMPKFMKTNKVWTSLEETFPGIGKEFMPALNEGSFLLMPSSMSHSGIAENVEDIASIDRRLNSIPEVAIAVGKWGRVNSALDPAPTSMYENTIDYIPEYKLDEDGNRIRFKVNNKGAFVLKDGTTYKYGKDKFRKIDLANLIPDKNGKYFRQWRTFIKNPDDIWREILKRTKFPGLTTPPKLQPIQTRLMMLSTGMRAPMGIKIFGPSLKVINEVGLKFEKILKKVPSVVPSTVFADRVIGKPYLEIKLNRQAMSRYGISVKDLQMFLSVAVGGKILTTSVEGRERFPIRVRYAREFRDNPDDLNKILIPTSTGVQVPLEQLAKITYRRGPQVIKSEDTF